MTDKKQQEQNCCEWMKIYWLDIVLVFIAIAGVTWLTCPEWMLLLEGQNIRAERNTAIRTLTFSYGAIVAFYGLSLGVRRLKATEKQLEHTGKQLEQTGRQLKITEAGFFYERFERGTESLKSNEPHTRIAGIRALKNVHNTVELDNQKELIRESLLDFIRREAGEYYLGKPEPKPREERVDIETAIKALGELVPEDRRRQELNMANLDLRNLDLAWVNLQGAMLEIAGLQNAELCDAKLQNAHLSGAKLQGADLTGAELQKADLTDTDSRKAKFTSAKLQGAYLDHAWLEDASLVGANLEGTSLNCTNLTEADLEYAKHFTKEQLETAIYEDGNPPKNLDKLDAHPPKELEIPKNRAYRLDTNKRGELYFLLADDTPITPSPLAYFEILHSKEDKT